VETSEEPNAWRKIDFELMQGFYFGKPAQDAEAATPPSGENVAGMDVLLSCGK
jgi:EAL domain-containing protein (putative c-di-GMP-specific phosphodiesterase class I)